MLVMLVGTIVAGPPSPETLQAETDTLRAWTASGVLQGAWVRADRQGAFLLVEAASEEEAVAHGRSLPFVEEGVMTVEAAPVQAASG